VCLGLLSVVMFGPIIFCLVIYDLLSYCIFFLSMLLFLMYMHVCINIVLHFRKHFMIHVELLHSSSYDLYPLLLLERCTWLHVLLLIFCCILY